MPAASAPSSLPYLALAGPTASGKTAAALYLAEEAKARWGITLEIISVDSALVYQGMDIGTAKPSAEERMRARHHLIDILDPSETYSAARFFQDATAAIRATHGRGHLPLLVGGTMLYYKALFEGLSHLPETDPQIRQQVAAQAAQQGWPALHAELARVDPLAAQRLPPQDSQRIGRALEVWLATGKPFTEWQADRSSSQFPPWPPLTLISLEPMDRAWLHQRIAQRFDAMLDAGFMAEVHALRARPDLYVGLPSMRCVGYRQAWEGLDNQEPLSSWREKAIAATRQLAKRQLTWLRSMPARKIVPCEAPDAAHQVFQLTETALRTHEFFSAL